MKFAVALIIGIALVLTTACSQEPIVKTTKRIGNHAAHVALKQALKRLAHTNFELGSNTTRLSPAHATVHAQRQRPASGPINRPHAPNVVFKGVQCDTARIRCPERLWKRPHAQS